MKAVLKKLRDKLAENPRSVKIGCSVLAVFLLLGIMVPAMYDNYRMEQRIEYLKEEQAGYAEANKNATAYAKGLPAGGSIFESVAADSREQLAEIEEKLRLWKQYRAGEISRNELPKSERKYAAD